ncbi:CDP-diacylglycerol--glycerol-3-phosphate 3-phosphatidyltransferase, putative [Babesia ovis]|uniref:CDP-diacylglycerol--glycerol-3-phosphate 3-phosphatidyltransferase, putative n=1 Tax=Babesia ovis TaxID=5869 RepID=A0A9W5WUM1_BABOV|nr:CDP-diacylglycerol--glycerol-3-phosphate 3-phosphatidyltransferase, putative [Babesia ovis]
MDVTASVKRLLCCLTLLLLVTGNQVTSVGAQKPVTMNIMVKRIKKAVNHLTDCSIDQLLKFCTPETILNFECFRTIGECMPPTARIVLNDDEDATYSGEDEL